MQARTRPPIDALERERVIDLQRAAEYLDVSIPFLRKRIIDGSLPAVKVGKGLRVSKADLDALKVPV